MRITPEAECDVTTRNRDTMRNLCDFTMDCGSTALAWTRKSMRQ